MTTTFSLMLYGFLFSLLLACSESPSVGQITAVDAPKLVQWYLPKSLREVSGLALVDDLEVLAIQDERAQVFRLNIQTGEVLGNFTLGDPAVKGDFEGLAIHKQQLYLLTSKGKIFKSELASDASARPYEKFDSGLSNECELEGLTHQPRSNLLWLVCKDMYKESGSKSLRLYAWSTETQRLRPDLTKRLPLSIGGQQGKLNPSGLAFTSDGQRLLIIGARQASYAWYTWGDVPKLMRLEKLPQRGKHRQAEGVAINTDGILLIADEGKKKRGTLSRYSALLD